MATDTQVNHYQEQARHAERLFARQTSGSSTIDMTRLQAVTGWQQERRQALMAFPELRRAFHASGCYALSDALMFAEIDIDRTLRDIAAGAIEEGMHMTFVHEQWPPQ